MGAGESQGLEEFGGATNFELVLGERGGDEMERVEVGLEVVDDGQCEDRGLSEADTRRAGVVVAEGAATKGG